MGFYKKAKNFQNFESLRPRRAACLSYLLGKEKLQAKRKQLSLKSRG